MTSPAQRSFARKVAAKAAPVASRSGTTPNPPRADGAVPIAQEDRGRIGEYELQRASIGQDLATLKGMQSVAAKVETKAAMLPKYDAWVDGVIEAAGKAESAGHLIGQDDVLVETMIWAIDCADDVRAMPRIRTFLRHGMDLPQRFDRTPGCLIAEEFAETALAAMATDKAHVPDAAPLVEIAELTADHDMPDPARAKLHKAIGLAIERATDAAEEGSLPAAGGRKRGFQTALEAYRRALAFDQRVGVKKAIERLEVAIRKLETD